MQLVVKIMDFHSAFGNKSQLLTVFVASTSHEANGKQQTAKSVVLITHATPSMDVSSTPRTQQNKLTLMKSAAREYATTALKDAFGCRRNPTSWLSAVGKLRMISQVFFSAAARRGQG